MNAVVENTGGAAAPEKRVISIDGENYIFAKKANVIVLPDFDNLTIAVVASSGHKTVWNIAENEPYASLPSLSELFQQILISSLANKLKNNVSSLDPIDVKQKEGSEEVETTFPLYNGILSNIKKLSEGKYGIRGTSSDEDEGLSLAEKAFGILWTTFPQLFKESPATAGLDWNNLEDPAVIADIQDVWGNLPKEKRGKVRKLPQYKGILAKLEMSEGTPEESLI